MARNRIIGGVYPHWETRHFKVIRIWISLAPIRRLVRNPFSFYVQEIKVNRKVNSSPYARKEQISSETRGDHNRRVQIGARREWRGATDQMSFPFPPRLPYRCRPQEPTAGGR